MELDDEFLVVWQGFSEMHGKPWDYKDEASLRAFLLERIQEGFSFPLNPVWPVRDKGWFEVFQALRASEHGATDLQSWFPPELDYASTIEKLHAKFPEGFRLVQKCLAPRACLCLCNTWLKQLYQVKHALSEEGFLCLLELLSCESECGFVRRRSASEVEKKEIFEVTVKLSEALSLPLSGRERVWQLESGARSGNGK
ncbi:unnamed protein product [Symbiodinium natans]|uniref:Uncharacterized protein n=1 Tax=Symbiodinium natans TaxID=878477 RepID=A0A812RYM3_9DINO|nr:unnamed protein product [Symbiodinium natans]